MLRLMVWLGLGLSVALCPSSVESAQILGLFGHPGKSHFDFFRPMFVALAERGHNVSMYSYFPLKQPMANYTDYVFEGMSLLTDFVDLQTFERQSDRLLGQPFKVPTFFMLHDWGLRSCRVALNSPLIAQLLSSPQRYDVIILEHFSNDCLAAVAHLLDAPVIALSSCAIMPWHYKRMGTPFINSIMPMNFLTYTDQMSFVERLNNFFHFHIVNTLYNFITQPATDAMISQRFGFGLPPINEIVKNTSLMLINQHHALTGSRPYAANVVEVGGLQVGPSKPLPKHLERILDASNLGVIYISWGSMVNPSTLPAGKLQALFDTISQLPGYTFVMRWTNQTLAENKPSNLHTYEWLPQRDLLCHPKVKAFVSHGGLLGTTESIYCAVPMLVTPFYGDQFLNAGAVVQRRFGVIVDFADFDEPHLTQALRTILHEGFATEMKRSTIAFRERPLEPLELAIWWIEHVIASSGAPLSQSVARHINWFVYNSIDVYVCCLTVALLGLGGVWKICKLLKWVCGRRTSPKTKQQ
ncbi:UDP-glucuronosyltransferase 1-3 [Drosophila novamexicana]|uniref:UDP-glucuronosyltransferase 1-3 n=1 Tax=Drosophila novamexicana TaxID=47314 RepID=UPI0011E5B228|nr:UDP-glucuronosyltransferase 1-3 [Drosophila novamexicana]XP_030556762.1 UDP-glucuronosyltransferase 1-3 [Drosophila novamexicana]